MAVQRKPSATAQGPYRRVGTGGPVRAAQQRSPCGSEISVSAFHGQKIRPEPRGQRWSMSNLDVLKLRQVDQGVVCHQVRHCATPNTIANISNLSFVDKGRGSHFAPINFSRTYRLSYFRPFRPHCQMDAEQAQRIWAQLRLAVSEIYNKNASVLSFEELYRCPSGAGI